MVSSDRHAIGDHGHYRGDRYPRNREQTGSQTGSQRRQAPNCLWRRSATINAGQRPIEPSSATSGDGQIVPSKQRVAGSIPARRAPVSAVQIHLDDGPEAVTHIDVWRAERAGADVKTPKSRRSLRLPDLCAEALRKQGKQQEQDRRLAGERWREHGLVFASSVGTPLLCGKCGADFASSASAQAGAPTRWTGSFRDTEGNLNRTQKL